MNNNVLTQLQMMGIDKDEIESSLTLPIEPFTIFLSGSIIEGFGNVESDLDVYVVFPEIVPDLRADFDTGINIISLEFTTNWRLDVESWAKEQMLAASDRIRCCTPQSLGARTDISFEDSALAHNIRIGIPIRHEEHFQQIKLSFDFAHLSHLLTSKYLNSYIGLAEDAAGAIASKQHGAAMLMSRKAAQAAFDAWLAAHGETNPKDKWRFNKLEKLGNQAMLERYWALETPQIVDKKDVLSYAKDWLLFAQSIVLQVQEANNIPIL